VKDVEYLPPTYYKFEKIESSNMQNECKYRTTFMYGTRSRIVFLCAWLQIEHLRNLLRVKMLYDNNIMNAGRNYKIIINFYIIVYFSVTLYNTLDRS